MYAVTMEGGLVMSPLDVCNTVVGPAVVPIPYPNMGEPMLADPVCETVLICGLPALNLSSTITLTEGDEPGEALGEMSGEIMGEARFTEGSVGVMLQGNPAVRLTAPTTQNACNCVGTCLVPSQTVVLIME